MARGRQNANVRISDGRSPADLLGTSMGSRKRPLTQPTKNAGDLTLFGKAFVVYDEQKHVALSHARDAAPALAFRDATSGKPLDVRTSMRGATLDHRLSTVDYLGSRMLVVS